MCVLQFSIFCRVTTCKSLSFIVACFRTVKVGIPMPFSNFKTLLKLGLFAAVDSCFQGSLRVTRKSTLQWQCSDMTDSRRLHTAVSQELRFVELTRGLLCVCFFFFLNVCQKKGKLAEIFKPCDECNSFSRAAKSFWVFTKN